jgi:hypothetical protein
MIFSSDQVHGSNGYCQFVAELGIDERDRLQWHAPLSVMPLAPTQIAHLRCGE